MTRFRESAWRIGVIAEVDHIEEDLSDLVRSGQPIQSHEIMQDLAKARSIARRSKVESERLNPIADWWSGTSIESAWQALHLAQEQLVILESEASLKSQAPHLMMLASIVYEPTHATEVAKQLTSSTPDPRTAKQVLVSYHARSDATHQAARNLRNIYLTLAGFIAAMDIVLTLAKVTSGAVVGLGALAGGLSFVFALQSGTANSPYNIPVTQAILKVASGAATGLMAVTLLAYGDATLTSDSVKAKVYAVAFGFSQQAFTQLADKRAGSVNAATQSRSAKAAVKT